MGSVAEGGSEVHQAGNGRILFWRSRRGGTREEERKHEQDREDSDLFEEGKPLASTHKNCDNLNSNARILEASPESGFERFPVNSKAPDARRRGATSEAYGAIRRNEKRAKATPQMMPYC